MQLPFVSRSSHLETIAAKDETIAILREANARLAESIARPNEIAETLDSAAVRERKPAPRPINYAAIDPNDNAELVRIAKLEMGGRASAPMLMRKVEQVKHKAIQARGEARQRSTQPGILPEAPAHVLKLIEEAELQGLEAART